MTDNSSAVELERSKPYLIVETIEYVSNAVLSKTIMKKATGNISVMSFDSGEEVAEKISPFDTFVQIIDGNAEVTIDKEIHQLQLGAGIIIPAHSIHCFSAKEQFKMISTVIKSGYEE